MVLLLKAVPGKVKDRAGEVSQLSWQKLSVTADSRQCPERLKAEQAKSTPSCPGKIEQHCWFWYSCFRDLHSTVPRTFKAEQAKCTYSQLSWQNYRVSLLILAFLLEAVPGKVKTEQAKYTY